MIIITCTFVLSVKKTKTKKQTKPLNFNGEISAVKYQIFYLKIPENIIFTHVFFIIILFFFSGRSVNNTESYAEINKYSLQYLRTDVTFPAKKGLVTFYTFSFNINILFIYLSIHSFI